jgi:DNA-binding NarL/FixJ family response regulator
LFREGDGTEFRRTRGKRRYGRSLRKVCTDSDDVALPLRARPEQSAPPSAVPEHLTGVLEQLASGATDQAACRRLGMSSRTYSRRVSELLEHFGVRSRFQAGVEMARRGLTGRYGSAPSGDTRGIHQP